MNRTMIEWVRNPDGSQGFTWSPITGCLNQIDGMCKGGGFPCYAYRLANGRLRERYLANMNVAGFEKSGVPPRIYNNPFHPRFWEDRLYKPKHTTGNRGIFVCDMSDLFGIGIPEIWTSNVMLTMELSPRHRFYLLTKQPQNLIKFSPFPENCWVGVTATDSYDFINRIGLLATTDAKVKYMSFEPLLGWEDFLNPLFQKYITMLDWVIIGAQTNPYKPPKMEWVQEIVEACDKAGVKVFLKDNLNPLFAEHITIADKWVFSKTNFMRGELYRQEMPNV